MSKIGNNIFCSLLLETLNHYVISLYTPGIYAEGYIVFVFPFVCLFFRTSFCRISEILSKVSR